MNTATTRAAYALMAVLGLFMVAQYYLEGPHVEAITGHLLQWKQPLNGFIVLLAVLGVAVTHVRRILRRQRGWGYSAVTVGAMAGMTVAGLGFGTQPGSTFATWFTYLLTPIEATMFSLLAFFVASAAYRAFRVRSRNAAILLTAAAVVLLALIPPVAARVPGLQDLSQFLLTYPNAAAKRAILIGVSLGAITVAVKTLAGIDRTLLEKNP